ncbi:MAG: rhomboid family intramembrane serine protease [Bacillota bacterium]|jgi:membrane associated rhomboid family serine protease|nr:rhomboid family intramembrane serine protease [Bacillota bacterium]HHU29218.1 rhomboid family intramembrane serine protease [Bacillota bacterium]
MIPLRDSVRTHSLPLINLAIIVLNIYVFVHQLSLTDGELYNFVSTYGLIPERFLSNLAAGSLQAALLPLFTHQFLHGSWLHIGSNMLYLWIFGDNIEDRMGSLRYLVFYLLMGLIAGLTQIAFNTQSLSPVIGASGAVAGILGAYAVICPRARVLALVPVFLIFTVAEVPAMLFLGLWFVLQLFSGLTGIGVKVSVAWWAHIGGFLAGMLLVRAFRRKSRYRPRE